DVLQPEIDPNSWGKPVSGVQTRLQASKAIWKQTEKAELRLEIRNVSAASLAIPVTQELGELEVDSKSYRWPAKVRVRIPRVEPREIRYVSVTLSSYGRNEAGEALALSPGNHSVRFALRSAWSNPVTIQILPENADAKPAEPIDKVTGRPMSVES